MLPSLSIRKFRNLEDLKIASLGRINLITGKNNTGKSTLLEAVSLYASRCDLNWISQLLTERGEYSIAFENGLNSVEANIKVFSGLFSNRDINFHETGSISIGLIENELLKDSIWPLGFACIRFVKYVEEFVSADSTLKKKTLIREDDLDSVIDFRVGLELRGGTRSYILALDDVRNVQAAYKTISRPDNFQFIRVRNIDREINSKLWDTITLTEKEVHVIEALRIIEPAIERLAFVGDEGGERTAIIKLKGDNATSPIRSMGDGINRVLTIILALVNSDNGYLFIDEFENGLHYSVQEKLWEIIFKLSEDLNVQVFATTHSEDCIRGFESILNSNQNYGEGKLIRLDNFKGKIRQTEYTSGELRVAAENYIETR